MLTRRLTTRAAALAAVAALALTGCSTQEAAATSRDAGFEYGKSLVKNLGQHVSKDKLRALCANAIKNGHLDSSVTGKPGKKVDYVAKQFVAGCNRGIRSTQ
ncbi:MAG: hypothetical protein ACXVXC_07535 [Nocardioidaceae bacterium]